MLLLWIRHSLGSYRYREPWRRWGPSGQEQMCLCPTCVRLMGSLRLSIVTQADFFPYHTEISPPANIASSGHHSRQTTLLSCLQSECSFTGSLGNEVYLYWYPDVRGRVGRRGVVGSANWAASIGSSLEEGFRLTIPRGSWENKKWKLNHHLLPITASVIHRNCSLRAAYIHQSLKWRVAFQCFVSSLTSSLPSSSSPLPDDAFALLLLLTFSTQCLRRCSINGVRLTLHEKRDVY